MVDERRKLQRKIAKQNAEARHREEMEEDTIYWLVFVPGPNAPAPTEEDKNMWRSPWRIRLLANPHRRPELIGEAIRAFEAHFKVDAWSSIATNHYVDSLYYP